MEIISDQIIQRKNLEAQTVVISTVVTTAVATMVGSLRIRDYYITNEGADVYTTLIY